MQSVSLPNDLVDQLQRLAADEHVSVAEVIHTALHDHVAVRESIARRATRASQADFLRALDLVPDVEPAPEDRV